MQPSATNRHALHMRLQKRLTLLRSMTLLDQCQRCPANGTANDRQVLGMHENRRLFSSEKTVSNQDDIL